MEGHASGQRAPGHGRRLRASIEQPPPLALGQVHVWRVPLPDRRAQTREDETYLVADEHERVGRFHFERDQAHFARCRATLRRLLGNYLGRAPMDFALGQGVHKKPFVVPADNPARVDFNVSHTAGLALIAVTREGQVGCDVERYRSDLKARELAARVFTADERAELERLPEHELAAAFLRGWTRKEAVIKASGMGLFLALESFSVTLEPERAGLTFHRTDLPGYVHRPWSLRPLFVGTAFAAALVTDGPRRCELLDLAAQDADDG